MLEFRFSLDHLFLVAVLSNCLCLCLGQCPSEIPFGQINSACTKLLNERCTYTCHNGFQYPNHERSLRWATCAQDPNTQEFYWNVPATAVCKAGMSPTTSPRDKSRLNAFKICSIVVGCCVLIPCVWVVFANIRKRRMQMRFSESTVRLQQPNVAISGSGTGVQSSVFSVTDNPMFNNDEMHLHSPYPLTLTNTKIVKPPDYNEIDFKDKKSPPSYTEAVESNSLT